MLAFLHSYVLRSNNAQQQEICIFYKVTKIIVAFYFDLDLVDCNGAKLSKNLTAISSTKLNFRSKARYPQCRKSRKNHFWYRGRNFGAIAKSLKGLLWQLTIDSTSQDARRHKIVTECPYHPNVVHISVRSMLNLAMWKNSIVPNRLELTLLQ